MLEKFGSSSRSKSGASFSRTNQGFGLGTGNRIAWMMRHGQPQPPIGGTLQTDHAGLIAQPDFVVHVPERGVGIALAGIGHRDASQVSVKLQPSALRSDGPYLSLQKGLIDAV